jgi:hypothetical protein
MAQEIKIKRSNTSLSPAALKEGELAYGYVTDEGRLSIGRPNTDDGSGADVDVVGGTQFVADVNAATEDNTGSAIVKRDATGNFSAGTITANLSGNASGSSGSCTGNAATATTLQTSRNINGVSFNGSADITLDADDIAEASSNPSNKYFTDTRAYTAIKTALNDATHSAVSVDFDDVNETIALTGTASVSAGTGVSVDGSEVSIGQAVATDSTPQFAKLGIGKAADADFKLDVDGDSRFKFTDVNGTFNITYPTTSNFASLIQLRQSYGTGQSITYKGFQVYSTSDSSTFSIQGYGAAFQIDRETNKVAIGTAVDSSQTGKLFVAGGIGTNGNVSCGSNVFIKGEHDQSDSGITFQATTDTEYEIRHDDSAGTLSIRDLHGSADQAVITIPHYNNANPNITIARNTDFTGNVSVAGTLTVTGTQTTITSTELAVGDNVITLNDDHDDTTAADEDSGIEIKRGLVTDTTNERAKAELVFDASALEWVVITPADADSVTQNAATPIITLDNIEDKSYVIDGGTFS